MKLFVHCLDTQIHLWGKNFPHFPHRNPLKKGSLSENAMKEDERVLFQPFHAKGNRRGLRCEDFETSADLLALSFRDTAISVKRVCQIKITMGNSWSVLHASKCPLVTAVVHHLFPRLHHYKVVGESFRGPTTTWADNGCFDYFINFTIFIVLVTIECVRFSIFNTLMVKKDTHSCCISPPCWTLGVGEVVRALSTWLIFLRFVLF